MANKRVALIGLGSWGEKIAKTLAGMDDVELVAACQRRPERPSWLPVSCHLYDDINDLLRKSVLTHVITALPPQSHLEVAKKVIQYELPLWLEKPIALSLKETNDILDLDGHIFVDYIHLYSECFQWLCSLNIEPTTIETIGYAFSPNTRHDFSILYDIAPHDLIMLFQWFDDIAIRKISCDHSHSGDSYGIEMIASGCHISTRIGNDNQWDKTRLFYTDGYTYDGLQQKVFKDDIEVFSSKERPLKHAIQAFLSGEQVNKDMTLKMMTLLEEIEARTKQ